MVELRDIVLYTDAEGHVRKAFVVRIHERVTNILNYGPSVNLISLSRRDDVEDSNGIQPRRFNNTPHRDTQSAPGNFWEEMED